MKQQFVEHTRESARVIATWLASPGVSDSARRKFGLSKDDIDDILEKQKHKCAICGIDFRDGYKPVVDHNHKTGEFRGLLCTNCNLGIGMLGDNPRTLDNACDYLLLHGWYGDCGQRYLRGKKRYIKKLRAEGSDESA